MWTWLRGPAFLAVHVLGTAYSAFEALHQMRSAVTTTTNLAMRFKDRSAQMYRCKMDQEPARRAQHWTRAGQNFRAFSGRWARASIPISTQAHKHTTLSHVIITTLHVNHGFSKDSAGPLQTLVFRAAFRACPCANHNYEPPVDPIASPVHYNILTSRFFSNIAQYRSGRSMCV